MRPWQAWIVGLMGLGFGCVMAGAAMALDQKTVVLNPKVRVDTSNRPPEGLLVENLLPSLRVAYVGDKKTFLSQNAILQMTEQQLLAGNRDLLYTKPLTAKVGEFFDIYRDGREYVHPDTSEILGYVSFKAGAAELIDQQGQQSILTLVNNQEAIQLGMRLLKPAPPPILSMHYVVPKSLDGPLTAYILGTAEDGKLTIGQGDVVLLSAGARECLSIGQSLDIYQNPTDLAGNAKKKKRVFWRKNKTEEEPPFGAHDRPRLGRLLVFQVEDKLSLALVTEALGQIKLKDQVKNP